MHLAAITRNFKRHMNGWLAVSMLGAAGILLPILYVLLSLFTKPNDNWEQVKQYLLLDYIQGTLMVAGMTAVLAAILGVGLAWLVTAYRFPFRGFFRWALILPLAMPPYIAAYTYKTMTSYTGIIQATLRNHLGITVPPGMIEVMSMRGAVFILTLCLFPYVFLITRTFLERQSSAYIDNARLLGRKGIGLFFQVVVPIARPAIIAGVMLVIFEAISDYGVVSYFGVQTVSTAIFQIWFGMYDVDSALRLAAWLMIIVIGIFLIERWLRRNRQFHSLTQQAKPLVPRSLSRWKAVFACTVCSLVLLLSFIVPVAQIAVWSVWTSHKVWDSNFVELTLNTMKGALLATLIIIIFATVAARVCRYASNSFSYGMSRVMTAGYATPGAVIAVGVLAVFISLDNSLSSFYGWMGQGEGALILSLSLGMLITGYVIRFMATGYNAMEAGYEKLSKSYTEAARTLGRGHFAAFFKIELPLIRGALFSGFVLAFVEIIKELPLTLLLRPFNFNTLATRAYTYAIDERIYEAALPSLLLIMLSLVSVLTIHLIGKRDTQ